jgi:hypothetical protein
MDLSNVYKRLLTEQGPQDQLAPSPTPAMVPPPASGISQSPKAPVGDKSIVELPSVNMNVSIFASEKKLIFSTQDHQALTEKIKKYVNFFKRNFRIDSINSLKGGNFEIVFDPREDFMAVIDFLQKLAQHDAQSSI